MSPPCGRERWRGAALTKIRVNDVESTRHVFGQNFCIFMFYNLAIFMT